MRIHIVRLALWRDRLSARLRRRKFRPLHTLDAAVLEQALSEARLLKSRYAVDVQPLAEGEKPEPRPAVPMPD